MNKTTFYLILESALLRFDGVSSETLINKYGIDKETAVLGIKVCEFLKKNSQRGVKKAKIRL